MKTTTILLIMGLVLSSLTLSSAADPDIEAFYSVPNNPYEDTHFEIYVRAEDDDGIDKIKFYIDGDLEETEDCDEDDDCRVYFDVYDMNSGYHTFEVKVYDMDDDTETDEIEVFVRERYNDYYYPYDGVYYQYDAPEVTYYTTPSQPKSGQHFSLAVTATDNDRIQKIEMWHGSSKIDTEYCGALLTCTRFFSISPKYTPGNYNFYIKAYDLDGNYASETANIYVSGTQRYYCGDNSCNNGESCSSCSQDCGQCVPVEPIIIDPVLPPVPITVIYTCEQRGGECCEFGGTGSVDGAADCSATCYTTCNAEPTDDSDDVSGSTGAPTGAIVMAEDTLVMGGMAVLIVLLVAYIITSRK